MTYEQLLLKAGAGDATLFIRRDEVETAWQMVDSGERLPTSLPR